MSSTNLELTDQWLEELRNWVAWQAICGAVDLPCGDLSNMDLELSSFEKSEHPQELRKAKTVSSRKASVAQPKNTFSRPAASMHAPTPAPPAPTHRRERPREALGGLWGAVLESRPQSFNPDAVQTGKSGLLSCQQHWESHCQEKKCKATYHPSWSEISGRGAPNAPIVLIEGHTEKLGPAGLSMLSNMRINVIGIPKEQLFWLPIYRIDQCSLSESMAQGQFNALQPKAVLLMGQRPLDLFEIDGDRAELGATLTMKTLNGPISAICTHHPNVLLKKPSLKREAFQHLQAFQRLIKRLGLI